MEGGGKGGDGRDMRRERERGTEREETGRGGENSNSQSIHFLSMNAQDSTDLARKRRVDFKFLSHFPQFFQVNMD